MEAAIKQALTTHFSSLFGAEISESMVQFQKTKKEFKGDITIVLFPFLKLAGKAPQEIGTRLGALLRDELQLIADFDVVGGFLNVSYPETYWIDALASIENNAQFGFAAPNSKPAIMVEYSSPNTNKPLHLGHLRNNFLGYSVAEILKANGHEVIKTQIINDRGIHICKSMLAWMKYSPLNAAGERETPSNTGMKGDKLVGKYYVEFDKYFSAETKSVLADWEAGNFEGYSPTALEKYNELNAAKAGKDEKAVAAMDDKIKELAKNETAILREAKDLLVRWEGRDPEVYLLWTTMNGWVYDGFESTYKRMGVDFDRLYYESETYILGKDIVQEGLKKGVFYQKEDGSVWIDLTDEGLDHKLLLRSDGTSVYMTQDVGTAVDRIKDYPQLSGLIYTVGNEQDYHFKVLFLILKKMGYSWADACYHLSYGMVELPKGMGRMKSREGTVVDADDLMEDIVETAREMTQERGQIEQLSEQEKENLYETIGMGGLKYFLLKVDPKKRIVFNPHESIELNGHTGPFIQYTHARICTLLEKGGQIGNWEKAQTNEWEQELIKLLEQFPHTIDTAAKEYAPSHLANYLYELVKSYNQFYQQVTILNESDSDTRNMRLALSSVVARTVKQGMGLLGIQVPKKM